MRVRELLNGRKRPSAAWTPLVTVDGTCGNFCARFLRHLGERHVLVLRLSAILSCSLTLRRRRGFSCKSGEIALSACRTRFITVRGGGSFRSKTAGLVRENRVDTIGEASWPALRRMRGEYAFCCAADFFGCLRRGSRCAVLFRSSQRSSRASGPRGLRSWVITLKIV